MESYYEDGELIHFSGICSQNDLDNIKKYLEFRTTLSPDNQLGYIEYFETVDYLSCDGKIDINIYKFIIEHRPVDVCDLKMFFDSALRNANLEIAEYLIEHAKKYGINLLKEIKSDNYFSHLFQFIEMSENISKWDTVNESFEKMFKLFDWIKTRTVMKPKLLGWLLYRCFYCNKSYELNARFFEKVFSYIKENDIDLKTLDIDKLVSTNGKLNYLNILHELLHKNNYQLAMVLSKINKQIKVYVENGVFKSYFIGEGDE